MGGLLFLPALCGEVFWSAGILAALGIIIITIMIRSTYVCISNDDADCLTRFWCFWYVPDDENYKGNNCDEKDDWQSQFDDIGHDGVL